MNYPSINECKCGKEGTEELHYCPYALDIGDEYELPEEERTLCNCCSDCENECAMDI